MARPHIEFIQSQVLPWSEGLYAGTRQGVQSKTLSVDDEKGSASVLVRYPPGWVQPGPGYLNADEEFFVLEGSLDINGQSYGEYGYAHLPAGYSRQSFTSRTGAVAVTFFSGEPDWSAGEAAPVMYDQKRLVEYIDGLNQPYDNDFSRMGSDDVNQNGIALKLLREDPYDREQTWLLGAIAFWPGGAVEIHPVVEEMFLVSGEIVGNFGSMKTGAYFWRPPGERHGPFATAAPTLHLFRAKGGPLSTVFEEPKKPFNWNYPHRPILPPHLQSYAAKEWHGAGNF